MTNGNGSGGSVDVFAPAKLNLALLVGPVRPDGFHEIASLMVPITLADRVTVEHTPGHDLEVVCDVAPGRENLAARVVDTLAARLGRPFEVRVTIHKQVPAGAGLGGGSSDAAATLIALERLFDLELEQRERYAIASSIGSDVSFFLWPGPQLAMGKGQVLKPVELPELQLVVVAPELALPTAQVYAWRDEDKSVDLAAFAPRARQFSGQVRDATDVDAVAALVHNDLEESVLARRPELGEVRARLVETGAVAAAMTGSGSAFFGLFADADTAARACQAIPHRAWHVSDLQPLRAS